MTGPSKPIVNTSRSERSTGSSFNPVRFNSIKSYPTVVPGENRPWSILKNDPIIRTSMILMSKV